MSRIDRNFICNAVGFDGIFTLILSNLVLLVTVAIPYAWLLYRVSRTAILAPASLDCRAETAIITGYLLGRRDCPEPTFRQRLDKGCEFLKKKQNASVVILGGCTGSGAVSEAAVGKRYMLQQGCDSERIRIEEESLHTLENLFNFRRQLENDPGCMSLVTSRYHMERSLVMARGLGLSVTPLAAEERFSFTFKMLLNLLMEAYLLHWYYVGKYWSGLSRNRNSLDRIS